MKHCIVIALFPLISLFTAAQVRFPEQILISAGISVPYEPEQFYDYWENGFGIRAEGTYGTTHTFSSSLSLEYNRFSFDEQRFFQRLEITEGQPAVEGGATTFLSLAGQLKYRVPGYEEVRPYCYVGLGIQYANRAEITIAYPFAPVTDASANNVHLILPVGASIEFSYKGKMDVVLHVQHTLSLTQAEGRNSDFTTLKVGIVLPFTMNEQVPE